MRDRLFPALPAGRDAAGPCSPKRFWFLWTLSSPFHELFKLGTDDRSPTGLKILPRIRRSFWKGFQTFVRQPQPRHVTFGKQFNRDQRIARFAFVAPRVGDFLLRDHLRDFAQMMITVSFMLDREVEFKADFRLEFFYVEVPLPHLIDIDQRLPNS